MHTKLLFGVVLAVISSTTASISDCKQCAKLASAATKYYNEEVTVNRVIEHFQNTTCPDFEKKDPACRETIAAWWPHVSKVVFNDDYGWFKISTWCPELDCSDEKADAETSVNCWDCRDRMNAQAEYFDDGIALSDVIYGLNYSGFCEASVAEAAEMGEELTLEECRKGMLAYVPRVMRSLKKYPQGDQVHRTLCKESVQCTLA